MITEHAELAPSSAGQTVQCPGSVRMQRMVPETKEERQEAADGTASHWCFAELFEARQPQIGQTAANGVVLDAAMIEGAQMFVGTVRRRLGRWITNLFVERRVTMSRLHPKNWGTPDAYAWTGGGKEPLHLWVFDYKFGHRFVSEFECWQLINYVFGILEEATWLAGYSDEVITVHIVIVQPRCYVADPVREWTVQLSDLRGYFNILRAAFNAAMSDNPPLKTGDACRDCRARHACPELQRWGYVAADLGGKAQPRVLDPYALGLEATILEDAFDKLKARLDGLKSQILELQQQRQQVPGWALDRTKSRDTWGLPPETVVNMGKMFNLDLGKPGVITPAQALAKGMPEEVINAIKTKGTGELKTVRDDGTLARRVFG